MFIVVTYLNFVKSSFYRDSQYICEIVFSEEEAREIKAKNSLSRAYRLYENNLQEILREYNTEMQKVLINHVNL